MQWYCYAWRVNVCRIFRHDAYADGRLRYGITLRRAGIVLLDQLIQFKDRQQYRQHDDADGKSHGQHHQRFHQPHQAGQAGTELAVIGDAGL